MEDRIIKFGEIYKKLDVDVLLDLYKMYCREKANTSNGKSYYFDDFIGWYFTQYDYQNEK